MRLWALSVFSILIAASVEEEACYIPGVIGSYTGRVNVTETGRICQRWDEDSPHKPNYRPSEADPKNYCRFLSGNRPWCYTVDPDTRWEYCDIPICDVPSYSGCYIEGTDGSYTGTVSVTESGRVCQRWASTTPHKPRDEFMTLPDNYCRVAVLPQPWCYTVDPEKRWDFCAVPECGVGSAGDEDDGGSRDGDAVNHALVDNESNDGCYIEGTDGSYTGTVSETESGRVCQRWGSTTPHKPSDEFRTFPDNYCRVAVLPQPWCYTVDPEKRWELCAVPQCGVGSAGDEDDGGIRDGDAVTHALVDNESNDGCYIEGTDGSYTGTVSETETGRVCQRWDSTTPHKPRDEFRTFPDNYCRVAVLPQPWCYTVDPEKRWELCAVPQCEIGVVTHTATPKVTPEKTTPNVTPKATPKVTPKATKPTVIAHCPRIGFIQKIFGEPCMDIGQLCDGLTISPSVTLSNTNTDQNFKLTLKSDDEILLTLTLTFGGIRDRFTDIVVTSPNEKSTQLTDLVEALERTSGIPFGFSVSETEGKPTIQIMDMNTCTMNTTKFAVGFSLDKRYDMCASGYGTTYYTTLSKTEECTPHIIDVFHDDLLGGLFGGYGDVDDNENIDTGPEPDNENTNTSGSQQGKNIISSRHRDIMVTTTTVGLSMSLFCLLLTVTVQIGTGKVKKTPGKLIVSLATSLFIAQLLFLVKDQPGLSIPTGPNTSDLGGAADVNDALDHDAPDIHDAPDHDAPARGESAEPVADLSDTPDLSSIPVLRELPCTIVAVTQHLAWLYTFSWSNTMVIDMLRAISSQHSVYRRGHTNTYPFYLLTASAAPCAIVATCLTLNFHFQFQWVRYGKPGDCWIQYNRAQVYFFAVPIAVSVLVNIALLVMVFAVIHKMREETSSLGRDAVLTHRRSAIIGLKLASVMGLTWIFGFLGSLLGNDVLLYMFTVINSLQGVYAFFGLSYDHSAVKRWLAAKLRNE